MWIDGDCLVEFVFVGFLYYDLLWCFGKVYDCGRLGGFDVVVGLGCDYVGGIECIGWFG